MYLKMARRVLFERAGRAYDDPAYAGAHHTLADELLAPSVIYAPAVLALGDAVDLRAVAHITGGGIPGNLNRMLPKSCDAVVDRGAWELPPIFGEIQRLGEVSDDEMAKVFNLGIGMVVVVEPAEQLKALDVLRAHGHRAQVVGEVVAGHGLVRLEA